MTDFDTRPRYGHNHNSRMVFVWTKIAYMTHTKRYVMARRPGCAPFIITERQWLSFPLWENQPDHYGPFPPGRAALAEKDKANER